MEDAPEGPRGLPFLPEMRQLLVLKVTENMLLPQNSGKFRASLKGHLGGERTSPQG